MERENHPVDQLFHEALYNREVSPPIDSWEKIRDAMDQRERRGYLLFWRTAAAMLLVLISLGIGYQWGMHRKQVAIEQKDIHPVQPGNKATNSLNSGSSEGISAQNEELVTVNSTKKQITLSQKQRVDVSFQKHTPSPGDSLSGGQKATIPYTEGYAQAESITLLNPLAGQLTESSRTMALNIHYTEPEISPVGKEIEIPLDHSETGPSENRWSIGGQVSPLYAFRDIRSAGKEAIAANPSAYQTTIYTVSASEHPVFSFSGGFNLTMDIAKNVTIETGLYYSSMGIGMSAVMPAFADSKTTLEYVYNATKGDASAAIIAASNTTGKITAFDIYSASISKGNSLVAASETRMDLTQRFGFMEFPVLMRVHLFGSRFRMGLVGGVITNILALNKTYYATSNGEVNLGPSEDLRKVNYSGSLGLGASLPVYGRWNFSMEPTFRYSVSPLYKGNGYTSHPYSFGVFTGLTYVF